MVALIEFRRNVRDVAALTALLTLVAAALPLLCSGFVCAMPGCHQSMQAQPAVSMAGNCCGDSCALSQVPSPDTLRLPSASFEEQSKIGQVPAPAILVLVVPDTNRTRPGRTADTGAPSAASTLHLRSTTLLI